MSSPAETMNELFHTDQRAILSIMSQAMIVSESLESKLFKREINVLHQPFYVASTLDLLNTILWNLGADIIKWKTATRDDGTETLLGFELDHSVQPQEENANGPI